MIGTQILVSDNTFQGRRIRAPIIHDWTSRQGNSKNKITKNVFRDNKSDGSGKNGAEQIVVGIGTRALIPSGATITYNSFISVSGDAEIIAVKTSSATIQRNKIQSSCGGISLRQGIENRVMSNTILGEGIFACEERKGL